MNKTPIYETFKCAMIFGNDMILQRSKKVPIFGSGDDGKEVTVKFQKQKVSTRVKQGKWKVILEPLKVCEDQEMYICCEEKEILITGVAVGEVWLAGGQSNMEFYLKYDADHDRIADDCENPQIRFFEYPKVSYEGQLEKYDYSNYGFWRSANRENIDYFSAVGYYYAAELQKKYQCPVGIIGCEWGGTTACCWMDPKYIEGNDGKVWLEDYRKAIEHIDLEEYFRKFDNNELNFRKDQFGVPELEKIMYGMTPEEMQEFLIQISKLLQENKSISLDPLVGPRYENRPGGLYETMLKNLVPYALKGIIWYQGESDDTHPEVYDTVFSSMIKCWRDLWQEELPFLFVQLAPFSKWLNSNGSMYSLLREKQRWVADHIPNTWMASIMDSGMEYDIHPKKKSSVGKRLALLAEGKVYGDDIICEAPFCNKLTVSQGRIELTFKHSGDGMVVMGEKINALELFCDEILLENYKIELFNDRIVLVHTNISEESKIAVQFAICDYCEVNLYNSAKLPARPFCISNRKVRCKNEI